MASMTQEKAIALAEKLANEAEEIRTEEIAISETLQFLGAHPAEMANATVVEREGESRQLLPTQSMCEECNAVLYSDKSGETFEEQVGGFWLDEQGNEWIEV